MKKIALNIILFIIFTTGAEAASYTITSVPYESDGFYYRDGSGNSISVNQRRSVPVITQDYPNAIWVPAQNGSIPLKSIVMRYENFAAVYYCKVQVDGSVYLGQLVQGDSGCYSDAFDEVINSYWILVRP